MDFNRVQEMVDAVNASNSKNAKLAALKNFPDVGGVLWWAYNPYKQFHVTSANLKKRSDLFELENYEMEDLLILLSDGTLTGHKAIAAVNGFIRQNPDWENLIYRIIDKNLEIRMDSKSINKVFPGLIPEFSVALAATFDEKMAEKVDFENEQYWASRKLDGVRCIARKEGNDVKFFSRNGKEFWTLDKVKEDILTLLGDKNAVLDGEICLVDEEGNEDFQNVMKEIRRKDHTIESPLYNVFDYLTLEEFDTKSSASSETLQKRYGRFPFTINGLSCIRLVSQTIVKNSAHLAELTKEAEEKGWEGLILRKNTPYKGKRSNDLLKVKKFHDAEYVVEGVETGPIRWINPEGQEVKEEMLSRIHITHKGNRVGVGSGFSMEQRREFFKDPSLIIGKTITVKYFQESTDQDGNPSLRFPTVKVIHGETRSV